MSSAASPMVHWHLVLDLRRNELSRQRFIFCERLKASHYTSSHESILSGVLGSSQFRRECGTVMRRHVHSRARIGFASQKQNRSIALICIVCVRCVCATWSLIGRCVLRTAWASLHWIDFHRSGSHRNRLNETTVTTRLAIQRAPKIYISQNSFTKCRPPTP